MLKIKENANLNDLLKKGFTKDERFNAYVYKKRIGVDACCKIAISRDDTRNFMLSVNFDKCKGDSSFYYLTDDIYNIIYDLITEGYLEKAPDEGEPKRWF